MEDCGAPRTPAEQRQWVPGSPACLHIYDIAVVQDVRGHRSVPGERATFGWEGECSVRYPYVTEIIGIDAVCVFSITAVANTDCYGFKRKGGDFHRTMFYISGMQPVEILILIFIAAFLIGSFPTAYLIYRIRAGGDLRQEGSGNIGTLNAYEVTRSRTVGVAVLLIDLIKGALPPIAGRMLFPDDYTVASLTLLAVVLGHNYSPWIGWKGGRGLAAAAGASLVFTPLFVGVWVLLWLAGYWKSRNVHFANIAATVLAPFVPLFVPSLFVATSSPTPATDLAPFFTFALLGIIVMLRHIGPLRQLIVSYREQS